MYPIEPRPAANSPTLNVRAIVTGAVVDISGTFNTEILIGLLGTAMWWSGGWSPETTLVFYSINLARGLGFTALGGYFSARTAGHDPLKHALVSGLISLLVSIGLGAASSGQAPFWYVTVGILLTLPAALLGGLIRAATVQTNPALNLPPS